MTTIDRTVLRPLRIGEILDRAIRLYRRHFLQFVGIVALVQVPLILMQTISSLLIGDSVSQFDELLNNPATAQADPLAFFNSSYLLGATLGGLVSILGFILLQGVAAAALTRAVVDGYLGLHPVNILDAYRRIKDSWISVIGALLLTAIIGIALVVWWFLVPCIGWITGGGMLMFLRAVIIPLMVPVIVLEKQSPTIAWRRAWDLARRRFWWVLAFALILGLFNLLVVSGPAALIGMLGQFVFSSPWETSSFSNYFTVQTIIQSLSILVTSLLYVPLQVACIALLYFDLRVRTEGLDIRLGAIEDDEMPQELDVISASAPVVAQGRVISGVEWRNFVLVTLGAIVILVALYAVLFGAVLALMAATPGF